MNNRYLTLLREIKSTCMATVDEHGRAQIRVIDVMLLKDNVLYFCTARGKGFHKELCASKHVAILGMTKQYQTIRVTGAAEHLGCDKDLVDEIFHENAIMETIYPGESRYILDVFCVRDASIEWFDLTTHPITKVHETIGRVQTTHGGFFITDGCVGCGICAQKCPQQCIAPNGAQYAIAQAHCLNCGLCAEQCPVGAIIRR